MLQPVLSSKTALPVALVETEVPVDSRLRVMNIRRKKTQPRLEVRVVESRSVEFRAVKYKGVDVTQMAVDGCDSSM